MSTPLKSDRDFEQWDRNTVGDSRQHRAVASSHLVNRTHRIVRERAASLQARRSRVRSLWIPLVVSGGLVSTICFAVWSVLEQNDITQNDVISNGIPDASTQMFVFLMWCLPVSAAVLAVVWYQLTNKTKDEGAR